MSLKITQLDLFPANSLPHAASRAQGELFLYKNELYMRVKPVSWMLNSSIIQDKLSSGHIVVVWLETGKLGFMKGTEPVEPVTGKLEWSK